MCNENNGTPTAYASDVDGMVRHVNAHLEADFIKKGVIIKVFIPHGGILLVEKICRNTLSI